MPTEGQIEVISGKIYSHLISCIILLLNFPLSSVKGQFAYTGIWVLSVYGPIGIWASVRTGVNRERINIQIFNSKVKLMSKKPSFSAHSSRRDFRVKTESDRSET